MLCPSCGFFSVSTPVPVCTELSSYELKQGYLSEKAGTENFTPTKQKQKQPGGSLHGDTVGDRHLLRELSPKYGQVLVRGLCISEKNLERTHSLKELFRASLRC